MHKQWIGKRCPLRNQRFKWTNQKSTDLMNSPNWVVCELATSQTGIQPLLSTSCKNHRSRDSCEGLLTINHQSNVGKLSWLVWMTVWRCPARNSHLFSLLTLKCELNGLGRSRGSYFILEKKFKVHMYIRLTSNTLQPSFSDFGKRSKPSLSSKSLMALKRDNCIRHIHTLCFISACGILDHMIN